MKDFAYLNTLALWLADLATTYTKFQAHTSRPRHPHHHPPLTAIGRCHASSGPHPFIRYGARWSRVTRPSAMVEKVQYNFSPPAAQWLENCAEPSPELRRHTSFEKSTEIRAKSQAISYLETVLSPATAPCHASSDPHPRIPYGTNMSRVTPPSSMVVKVQYSRISVPNATHSACEYGSTRES